MSARRRSPGDAELAVGQLRKQVFLETEAVYRVCEVSATSVQVEVVRAPGLTPGQRFTFTAAAVLRMALLAGDGPDR
jgi:hypothetical protein